MSIFSKNLRHLRKRGNHNQDEIALLFKKRANTIGNWENEKSEPNLAELMKLGEFFQVSVQDFLHTEMEASDHSPRKFSASTGSKLPTKTPATPYFTAEVDQPKSETEGSPDAFWLILRELRVIGEKLDSLVSGSEPGSFKRNSDKSYH